MAKRLSQAAIKKLFRKQGVKEAIVEELGLAEENGVRTVRKWILNNKPNGKLTCDAVVKILKKELKMSKVELLEDVSNGNPVIKRRRKSYADVSE